ncbi:translation initiation factor eIF 4e-like domain-containing protein [Pelagophyceae sp. CCMP2097]|nr:translation initiation factor eIF 4e-like domain-containing protein [Pelagophyceae sp. CCMP2097]
MQLEKKYALFYMRRQQRAAGEPDAYASGINKIGTFDTAEGFWGYHDHLVKPHNMQPGCLTDFHMFRDGIAPTWEDPENARGGKWILRLRKVAGLSSLYWEALLLAIVGEQFEDVGRSICGCVVSVRINEDIISVWNRDANDSEATSKLRDLIASNLQLPDFISLEYKKHAESMSDKSSFRGVTDRPAVWRGPAPVAPPPPGGRRFEHGAAAPRVPAVAVASASPVAAAPAAPPQSVRDWSTLRARK